MRRDVGHATRHARRAKAACFAGECHHKLVAASVAAQPHAPVFEKAAAQITVDLAAHELGQTAARHLIAAIDEARPSALHHFMENRFLRPSALVAVRTLRCRMHMSMQPRPRDLVRGLVSFR
jgi:hypothetical protein